MSRYRIYSESNGGYNGCIPITVHWVQVLKETLWGTKWEKIKGFEDKRKIESLIKSIGVVIYKRR